MPAQTKDYRKTLYLASIIVAVGITLTTTLKESVRPIGVVFIAIGGLFFIIAMRRKRQQEQE